MRRVLLIVWWTTTGGTRQLVDAAAEGAAREVAEHEALELRVRHCDAAGPQDLLDAAGTIFATPEHLASMAGPMKHFFDRCYYPVLDRIEGRAYATLVCAGSDGQGTVRQIDRIATGWRLKRVAEPLVSITHAQTPEAILAPKTIAPAELERARELGAAMAAGIALGVW